MATHAEALTEERWQDRALCADYVEPSRVMDSNIFEPDEATQNRPGSASMLLPILLCDRCPVRRPCLAYALTQLPRKVDHGKGRGAVIIRALGIWGATTETERKLALASSDDALGVLLRTHEERLAFHIGAFRDRYSDTARGAKVAKVRRILRKR